MKKSVGSRFFIYEVKKVRISHNSVTQITTDEHVRITCPSARVIVNLYCSYNFIYISYVL